LDDNDLCEADDLVELISGSEERKMGTRECRRHQRIPQGSVENGFTRIYACPLILSSNNSTQIYYAARPNSSTSSFSTPSSTIRGKTCSQNHKTQLDANQKIKKWLIEYLAVKEVNADNKTREAAAITAATE